jgi:hypothetical protein
MADMCIGSVQRRESTADSEYERQLSSLQAAETGRLALDQRDKANWGDSGDFGV